MGELAESLLVTQKDLGADSREFLVVAAMAGHVAAREPARAAEIWDQNSPRLPRHVLGRPVFRLLRCHAARSGCAAAFAAPAG
jgi:hypothetical protein